MAKQRQSYLRKVSEVFGYSSEATSSEALRARRTYQCPFLNAKCVKPSQHGDYDVSIPFGACSVWHRGTGVTEPYPHVICPVRFVQNHQIFWNANRLFETKEGTETIIIPEASLPMGRIDYILAQYDPSRQQVVDFNILEVMACSTTGTGDVLRSLHDVLEGSQIQRTLKYGINYRQVISRMMVQILAKAFACEKWNKRMIWAVQDVFYRYMQATTKIDLKPLALEAIDNPRETEKMPILFFVYGMDLAERQEMFELKLKEVYGGTKEDFTSVFEPLTIPDSETVTEMVHDKIVNSSTSFRLSSSLDPENLARVASSIVKA